jgi:hypothetical protein
MTAFVSGFRWWYGDGVGGARLARKAASAAGRAAAPADSCSAPPETEGSMNGLPGSSLA